MFLFTFSKWKGSKDREKNTWVKLNDLNKINHYFVYYQMNILALTKIFEKYCRDEEGLVSFTAKFC